MVDASLVHICLYVATLHVSFVLCKGFGDDYENVPQVVSGDCGRRMMAIVLQFAAHARPRRMLLATAAAALVEVSSHDYFWGHGVDGSGANHLGLLLMRLREELAAAGPGGRPSPAGVLEPGAPGGRDSSAWAGAGLATTRCAE